MPEAFDAVVIGSGASGGWVAKELTEAGLRVAVLEAGRKLDPAVDHSEHKRPFEMPLRGRRYAARDLQEEQQIQKQCYQCDEYTGCQNPTVTIIALASRASARLVDEMKRESFGA